MNNLTPEATLLYFLRTLFASGVDYAVYIPGAGDIIVLSKNQLAVLVERGCADAMIKALPQLAARNIFKPLNIEEIERPNEIRALFVENAGAFINSLETALYPEEPNFPEWWNAPVPFAICSRGVIRLNETAINLFGSGLEKMDAQELPDRDEFIVRLDGLNGSRFIAFKKLKAGIFTIDDCTEDLNDAQDITWWAAVGRAWVREIEAQGGKWQRLNAPPEGKTKGFRACEWQGEIQGYIDIEMPKRKIKISEPPQNENEKDEAKELKESEQEQEPEINLRQSDDVISQIGPQTMALLAAGQTRDDFLL